MTTGPSSKASDKGDRIPIGSMLPLTGPSAADGKEFRNGILMAVDEINELGGILGKELEPHFRDTRTQSAEEVVAAAHSLIEDNGVHAIVNGYNIGPQNSEYEAIADAGIIYIHHNTLLQHHDTVTGDPARYFSCFMGDPAEYWYGQGFIKLASWLRDSGKWQPRNNRLAIISGAKPYSIVIANAMASCARQFGWQPVFGPRIAGAPITDWMPLLDEIREIDPAILANTHFYTGDLARFHLQFMERPLPCLLYLQYGAMHRTFRDIVGDKGRGAIVGTVIGLLRDSRGKAFAKKYRERYGENSTPEVGCQPYTALHHYAIAASLAGGTGGPGDFAQNGRIAQRLKSTPFRSVAGVINYHPEWQAAIPYPDAIDDPSLGIPHLFYQIGDSESEPMLIAPEPYNETDFKLPPWLNK